MKLNTLDSITLILVLAGGVNWGLVGAFNFDLVYSIFGMLSDLVYVLVGLSAVYIIWMKLSKKA